MWAIYEIRVEFYIEKRLNGSHSHVIVLFLFVSACTDEATITNITKILIVGNGSDAELACTVNGNPIESYHVTWEAPDVPNDWNKRSYVSFENNTSILKLVNVTKRDMGLFYCMVNNTIGSAVNDSSRLIIERECIFYFALIEYVSFFVVLII